MHQQHNQQAADLAWDLDFTVQTVEEADKGNAHMPDGWYRVRVDKITDDTKDGKKIFTLRVLYGPFVNKTFPSFLLNPRYANSQEAAEMMKKKANCWASRLGVADKNADGKIVSTNFGGALGKEVVVKLSTGKPNKDGKQFQGIDFDIYPVNPLHATIQKNEILAAVGLPLLPSNVGGAVSASGQNSSPPQAHASQPMDQIVKSMW